jgi:predicted ester cyclase
VTGSGLVGPLDSGVGSQGGRDRAWKGEAMADLKDLSRRFYKEVIENGNIDAADELWDKDAIEHEKPPPGVTLKKGREGAKQLMTVYLDSFSGFSVEIYDQIAEGDKVVCRVAFNATHTGDFAGIPPTGKSLSVEAVDTFRYKGERIIEHWGIFDALGMLTQMGVVPEM